MWHAAFSPSLFFRPCWAQQTGTLQLSQTLFRDRMKDPYCSQIFQIYPELCFSLPGLARQMGTGSETTSHYSFRLSWQTLYLVWDRAVWFFSCSFQIISLQYKLYALKCLKPKMSFYFSKEMPLPRVSKASFPWCCSFPEAINIKYSNRAAWVGVLQERRKKPLWWS